MTGAFGFIGSHLVEKLLENEEEVVAVGLAAPREDNRGYLLKHRHSRLLHMAQEDVNSMDNMKQLLKHHQPSVVYHLAAIASHRLSKREPYMYLHNNYNSVLSILEAARLTEPTPKIVFSSSSSVYGDNEPPLKEIMQPQPKGPYALSKFFGEELCKLYSFDYGLNCIVIRYFNVVGERCRGNIVFRVFAERILRGEPLEVGGRHVDGVFKPAMRDFTYVADAVEGTLLAGKKVKGFEIFNIGFGRPVSVMKIAELMLDEFGKKLPLIQKELLPHETLVSYSDSTKAREKLGWSPKIDVNEMVARFVEWVKAGGLNPQTS